MVTYLTMVLFLSMLLSCMEMMGRYGSHGAGINHSENTLHSIDKLSHSLSSFNLVDWTEIAIFGPNFKVKF